MFLTLYLSDNRPWRLQCGLFVWRSTVTAAMWIIKKKLYIIFYYWKWFPIKLNSIQSTFLLQSPMPTTSEFLKVLTKVYPQGINFWFYVDTALSSIQFFVSPLPSLINGSPAGDSYFIPLTWTWAKALTLPFPAMSSTLCKSLWSGHLWWQMSNL